MLLVMSANLLSVTLTTSNSSLSMNEISVKLEQTFSVNFFYLHALNGRFQGVDSPLATGIKAKVYVTVPVTTLKFNVRAQVTSVVCAYLNLYRHDQNDRFGRNDHHDCRVPHGHTVRDGLNPNVKGHGPA